MHRVEVQGKSRMVSVGTKGDGFLTRCAITLTERRDRNGHGKPNAQAASSSFNASPQGEEKRAAAPRQRRCPKRQDRPGVDLLVVKSTLNCPSGQISKLVATHLSDRSTRSSEADPLEQLAQHSQPI